MTLPSKLRRLLLGTLCALSAAAALAQASAPQASLGPAISFDETTWAQLLKTGPRPAAYLFTTSYCSTCPEAFAQVQAAVQQRKLTLPLVAVMMDVSGPQALRHAVHFPGLTQMYAFDGFEPAIRQSVDPAWPNVTPYVVLIDKRGQTQRFIGAPTPAVLKRWLG